VALEYVGGLPDWCGEAANRKRLEEWYAGFGQGGIPCPICEVRKVSGDLRRLAHHLAAGKDKVTVKPPAPTRRRAWSVTLLASPHAVVGGEAIQELQIVYLQLTCSHCENVQLFDAKAIGIAV
jgi:hypothetical protein